MTRDDLKPAVEKSHSKSHSIYFTHSNLPPTNILVEDGKLAGIVDFGCSGFLPEYWEYTKMMYGFWSTQKPWLSLSMAYSAKRSTRRNLRPSWKCGGMPAISELVQDGSQL